MKAMWQLNVSKNVIKGLCGTLWCHDQGGSLALNPSDASSNLGSFIHPNCVVCFVQGTIIGCGGGEAKCLI